MKNNQKAILAVEAAIAFHQPEIMEELRPHFYVILSSLKSRGRLLNRIAELEEKCDAYFHENTCLKEKYGKRI